MTREGLAEFADSMLVGLLVAVVALPVLTAPSGFAAACTVLADRRDGRATPLLGGFLAALRVRWRTPVGELLVGLLFGLLLVDVLVVTLVMGPGPVRVAVVAAAVVGSALLAATAGGIGAGSWLAAARRGFAARKVALLVAAVLAAAVLVAVLPPLALVIGGPLALAATVDR